jgi:hypothetical protein
MQIAADCVWSHLPQAKGGSFAKDKDFYRFTLGRGEVIPAFEEALLSMREGGIRRIVVPVELGYPGNDMNALGPSPTTFSVRGGSHLLCFVFGVTLARPGHLLGAPRRPLFSRWL